MKQYIVFGNRPDIDNIIDGKLEKVNYPYETKILEEKPDYIDALAKVEQYGSFSFISEKLYNTLSDD